jgi:site-specific DNA recombinase
MRGSVSQASGRVAAIYARVSSERQREQQTIESQVAGLRELADERGLLIPDELVFCDEGFSGATLIRPALERLRDRAGEGAFEVLLCHAPDRLARRYAYQVLLLEELARAGVELVFARGGERSGSPEDELLRQFQGMIAEYERAQIRERTRRGKLHRARTGSQAVMAGAPYGYRFVRKTEHTEGYWEVDEAEAQVVRELFRRYVEDGCSIADLARWLTDQGIPTRKGKSVWDRSTVWGMLRNPAYRGQAAYGKTKVADRHGNPTRTTRARGERHGRRQVRVDEPVDRWMFIPVPALVSEEQFALAQERLRRNAHFAKRNTREPGPLQGLVVCRECGYSCYRTSTRTTKRKIVYYRCIGQDNWRHVGGRVCQSRPIRADELEPLVWGEVRRLLEDPALVRAEIDRRLHALRTEHPAARRREALERDLTRAAGAIERLIEAYQEQLLSLDELRARMPALRKRQTTLQAQLDALDAELHDAETYLKLADTLEGFLTRLGDGLDQLNPEEQQRILRLVVREVLIGGDEDKITIRHSIPTPNGGPNGSYPLRGSSRLADPGEPVHALRVRSMDGPELPGLPIRALLRRRRRALQEQAAGRVCACQDRRADGGGRLAASPRQNADRLLQGRSAPGGARAHLVHLPRVRLPGTGGARQERPELHRLLARDQPRGAQGQRRRAPPDADPPAHRPVAR